MDMDWEFIAVLVSVIGFGATLVTMSRSTKQELKKDINDLRVELKGEMSQLESRFKDDLHSVKDDLHSVKEDIRGLRMETRQNIDSLRIEIQAVRSELKDDLRSMQNELKSVRDMVWVSLVSRGHPEIAQEPKDNRPK